MSASNFKLDPIALRIGTVIFGTSVVTFLLIAAVSFFGDAVASTANTPALADFSKSMAPGNPNTYRAASLLLEDSFREEDLKLALKDSEKAAALSPGDYVLWVSLARLRERSGDIEGAEKALRRALQLAPNYSSIHWALGNVLLRKEEYDEGFRLIRAAVESDRNLAGPAASIAWDIFDGDQSKVQKAIGGSKQVRAALTSYLARLQRVDEAYQLWISISPVDREAAFAADGNTLLESLLTAKKYLKAVSVQADILDKTKQRPVVEKITNGGFEDDISSAAPKRFDWSIAAGDSPSIGISVEEKKSGSKSLALVYSGEATKEFREVSQTIAVRGGKSFTFSLSYKSELQGKQTLVWHITDLDSGEVIASTQPVDLKTGWKTIEKSFTVPEGTEGIKIILANEACPNTNCPIRGTVWFDDFVIE